ncbi:hypothetical protein CA284_22065, partial [Enterobacter mori]
DTLVPTTYLVDTTLSNTSDYDQTALAVRLLIYDELYLFTLSHVITYLMCIERHTISYGIMNIMIRLQNRPE